MDAIVVIEQDDYAVDVNRYLQSPGWAYLRARYLPQAQALLVRALTISGLEPQHWERASLELVVHHPDTFGKLLVDPKTGLPDDLALRYLVAEIEAYAADRELALGEPPVAPVHLAAFGCTPESYAHDLEDLSGELVDLRYRLPWPQDEGEAEPPPPLGGFLGQAAAIMGATAGALEQLTAWGLRHGRT